MFPSSTEVHELAKSFRRLCAHHDTGCWRRMQSELRQFRAALNSSEQQRAAVSSREQQGAAESSREQQRAAESSSEQQRAAESSRKQQNGVLTRLIKYDRLDLEEKKKYVLK